MQTAPNLELRQHGLKVISRVRRSQITELCRIRTRTKSDAKGDDVRYCISMARKFGLLVGDFARVTMRDGTATFLDAQRRVICEWTIPQRVLDYRPDEALTLEDVEG